MIGDYESITLLCLALVGVAPVHAQTGSWSSPRSLSNCGQGWEAAAATDAAGNSLALWDERTIQDQLWSRFKTAMAIGDMSLRRKSCRPCWCFRLYE